MKLTLPLIQFAKVKSHRKVKVKVSEMNKKFLAIIFVFLVGSLSACEVLLIGSAAVATYEVLKDERSATEVATDTRIVADIKQKLLRDQTISGWDINVDSFKAVVTLHGNIPSTTIKERVILVASSVKGVEKIVSKLVIVPKTIS